MNRTSGMFTLGESSHTSTGVNSQDSEHHLRELVTKALENMSRKDRNYFVKSYFAVGNFELQIIRETLASVFDSMQSMQSGYNTRSSTMKVFRERVQRCNSLITIEKSIMAKLRCISDVECLARTPHTSSHHSSTGNEPSMASTSSQGNNITNPISDPDHDGTQVIPALHLSLSPQTSRHDYDNLSHQDGPSVEPAQHTGGNPYRSVSTSPSDEGFRADKYDNVAIMAQWREAFAENRKQDSSSSSNTPSTEQASQAEITPRGEVSIEIPDHLADTSEDLIDLHGDGTFASTRQVFSPPGTPVQADSQQGHSTSNIFTPPSQSASYLPPAHVPPPAENVVSVTYDTLQGTHIPVKSSLQSQSETISHTMRGDFTASRGSRVSRTSPLQDVTAEARIRNMESGSEAYTSGCQAVIISGLPQSAVLQDVMSRVRGGKILQVTLVDTSAFQVGRSAYVVFAESEEASAYVDFAKENPEYMNVFDEQMDVNLSGRVTFPRHGMRLPQEDQTRCVSLGRQVFRDGGCELFEQIDSMYRNAEEVLEDAWFDETGSCVMLFKNVEYAIRFYYFARAFHGYRHMAEQMRFLKDPCSGPLADLLSPCRFARGDNESFLSEWMNDKYGVADLPEDESDQSDMSVHEHEESEKQEEQEEKDNDDEQEQLLCHYREGILIDLSDEGASPAARQNTPPTENLVVSSANLSSDATADQTPYHAVTQLDPLEHEPLPHSQQDSSTADESRPAAMSALPMKDFLDKHHYQDFLRDRDEWKMDHSYMCHEKNQQLKR